MSTFRFAHLADVHLGAPRFGEPALAGDGARALEEALEKAREASVDFVVIAGGLFHRRDVPPDQLRRAEELLAAMGDVPVLAVAGPAEHPVRPGEGSYLDFLAGKGLLQVLEPGQGREPLPGVRLHALGDLETRLTQFIPSLTRGERATLGVFHGRRSRIEGEALRPLQGALDFVAAGHPEESDRDGWLAYPGPLQQLRIGDGTGEPPGMLLVEFREGVFEVERVPVRGRAVVSLPPLEVEGVACPTDVERRLEEHLSGCPDVEEDAVLALRLTGQVPFDFAGLDEVRLATRVREHLKAAHVVLLNELNLGAAGPDAGPMDRRTIEREVLREALEEELPDFAGRHDELLEILETVLRRAPQEDEELMEILEQARALVEGDHAPA